MYHIIYSKPDNNYIVFYKGSDGHLYYTVGFQWHTDIVEMLDQPPLDTTAFQRIADSKWLDSSIYSSPTYPTISSIMATNPELLI